MSDTLAAFEAADLSPEEFDHAAHIECAWRCLDTYGQDDGRAHFRAALRQLTKTFGQAARYHETITCFYLDLIEARRPSVSEDFAAFRSRNRDLFEDARALLLRYYRPETLESEAASSRYLPPDRGS